MSHRLSTEVARFIVSRRSSPACALMQSGYPQRRAHTLLPSKCLTAMISGIPRGMTASSRVVRHGGLFDAVLFDRDSTLIDDVPYNGDPGRVVPVPGARDA